MESFWVKSLRWKQIFTNYTALRFGEKSESLQAFHQRGAWPMMEEIQHKGSCFANIRGQWRWNNWFPNKEDKTICEVQRVITTNAPLKLKLHHWKNSRLSTMKWDNRILLMGFVQGNPSNLRVFMWWLVLFFVEWWWWQEELWCKLWWWRWLMNGLVANSKSFLLLIVLYCKLTANSLSWFIMILCLMLLLFLGLVQNPDIWIWFGWQLWAESLSEMVCVICVKWDIVDCVFQR